MRLKLPWQAFSRNSPGDGKQSQVTPPDNAIQDAGRASTMVITLEEIDSTNVEAGRHASRGESGPLWITARRQSRGKGRSGRSFQSPPGGNLYASLLLSLVAPAASLPQISLLAGVAACDAIASVSGRTPPKGMRLKWPNDILIGDGKLCGILTESTMAAESPGSMSVVIGWGINLAIQPTNLDRPVTSLAAQGVHVSPEGMLGCLDEQVFRWLSIWDSGHGFASIRAAWIERAGAVGERLIFNSGQGPMEGTFVGLDEDGALLMADSLGHMRRVTFGDVALADQPSSPDTQSQL